MKIERTTVKEIGERLRATRKDLGLDVQTISHELNLPVDIIEAIENGSIESHYQEIFAIACRLSKPVHEIFEGFFNYNNTQIFFLETSLIRLIQRKLGNTF